MINLTFRVVRTLVLAKNIQTKLYNPSMQIPEFGEKNLRIQIRLILFFFSLNNCVNSELANIFVSISDLCVEIAHVEKKSQCHHKTGFGFGSILFSVASGVCTCILTPGSLRPNRVV